MRLLFYVPARFLRVKWLSGSAWVSGQRVLWDPLVMQYTTQVFGYFCQYFCIRHGCVALGLPIPFFWTSLITQFCSDVGQRAICRNHGTTRWQIPDLLCKEQWLGMLWAAVCARGWCALGRLMVLCTPCFEFFDTWCYDLSRRRHGNGDAHEGALLM